MSRLRNIKKSFKYAFNGLFFAVANERNFRIHLVFMVSVLYFSKYYNFSKEQFSILILTIMIVLLSEMVNTVIEVIINFLSPSYSIFAKLAKDVAAGAVLVVAMLSAIIGYVYFFKLDIILFIIHDIFKSFFNMTIFIVYVLLSIGFIFCDSKSLILKINKKLKK